MFDVVVIGGGPAGVSAALRARDLGAKVALVEGERMGGTCTNDGCVPTRVLAKTARLMREAEHFGTYGLIGDRPKLDFVELLSYARGIVETIHQKKKLGENLGWAGVSVYAGKGSARFTDSHTLALADGTSVQGQKIIICSGGHARKIAFPGSDATGVITHHDVWSLQKLPRSVIVVGAAATGCQLASVLAAFGAQVRLLEVAPRILSSEDHVVSQSIDEAFQHRGIEIITAIAGIDRLDAPQENGTLTLWFTRHGESHSLTAEAVIMAVGWVGNIENLNLPAARVDTEHGYIVVDDRLQTSTHHIFAAGDVTGRVMLVQSANYDGRHAAENAVLGKDRRYPHTIIPHGGFTDPEYGGVGLTEEQARATEDDCVSATVPYSDLDRAVIDGHTAGFCKLLVSRRSHLLLGAHVVGEQAVEIAQLAATAMAGNIKVEQLAELELAYPTYTDIISLAARQSVRKLGLEPVPPHWRSMGM
jgi:pyruvate/2-oxoglutarate dehydrogenase complex dihydrolipoamide dehydrogenase (E3) component